MKRTIVKWFQVPGGAKMHKLSVLMLAVACAQLAWAGSVTLANPAVGGNWNDPATWSGDALPAAGDDLLIVPAGDITLSLTADVAADFTSLMFRSANSSSEITALTLATGMHSLSLPYSADGRYAAIPVKITDGNQKTFFEVNDSQLSNDLKNKAAPFKLDTAGFKLSQTAQGAVFRLERGMFNAYDPGGTAYAGRQLKFFYDTAGARFEAARGTVLEWPEIISGVYGAGSFLFDGATVNIHGNAAFGMNNRYYYHGIATVSATNSTINVSETMGLYGKLDHIGEITNTFDRCDLSVKSFKADWGATTIFNNCRLATSDSVDIGDSGDGSTTEVFFNGGEYSLKSSQIGKGSTAKGKLSIQGGAVVEFGKSGRNFGQQIGWRGTGVVDVVNGILKTENTTYHSLYVGAYADGYGTGHGVLNVYDDGQLIQPAGNAWATDGIAVGGIGRGILNVYGGDVRASKIHIGYTESCGHSLTQEIHQTGGRVRTDYFSADHSYVGLAAYAGCGNNEFDKKPVPQRAAYYLDGGVLETARVYGGLGSACRGGSGYSKFSADGGVFKQNMSPGGHYSIENFDLAEFGDKGLTFDSNGFNVKIRQDFVNKPGESGVFIKAGTGELSYTGVCSVAELRVEGGTFKVENGATIDSAVAVGNDATLSLEGEIESLNLTSLAITNGIVRLDPGDTITVDGAFSSDCFRVLFTSVPQKDQVLNVLTVNGAVDDEAENAIGSAFSNIVVDDETYFKPEIKIINGKTVVSVTRTGLAAPIAQEKTSLWNGSGNWSEPSNWNPSGVPGVENKAAFSAAGSETVTVETGALVGALAFTAGNHKIEGNGAIEIAAPEGAAEVSSAGGTNIVSVPVQFVSKVKIPVEEGSTLDFERTVVGSGFVKTGLGTLRFGGDNILGLALSHTAGTLSLGSATSLGRVQTPALRFTGGVLAVSNATGEAVALRRHVEMDAGQIPVVYDTPTDASIALRPLSGPVFKRGDGTLTLEFNEAQNTFSSGFGRSYTYDYDNLSVGFDANGALASTTQATGALTVVEGRLRLTAGKGCSGRPQIKFNHSVAVGSRYREAKSDPILELDGVDVIVSRSGDRDLSVGLGMNSGDTPNIKECALIMNNATIRMPDYWSRPLIGGCTEDGCSARLSMSNSTFALENEQGINFGGRHGAVNVRLEAVDSTITYGKEFVVSGGLAGDVTNTIIKSKDGMSARKLSVGYNYAFWRSARGYLRLAAGSDLRVNDVYWARPDGVEYIKDFRLIFDDASWTIGESDIALEYTESNKFVDPNLFSVECQKGGLRLPVLEGFTFSSDCRFFGEGGIVKTGGGTLKFGNGAYDLSGVTRIEEGTLDLSKAGTVTNAVFAGSGRILGATFGSGVSIDPGIGAGWTTGDVPVLENCLFAAPFYVTIDPSLASSLKPSATGIVVARFAGTPPDVSRWRVSKIWEGERGVRGRFEVQGNTIRMTVERVGFSLIVR